MHLTKAIDGLRNATSAPDSSGGAGLKPGGTGTEITQLLEQLHQPSASTGRVGLEQAAAASRVGAAMRQEGAVEALARLDRLACACNDEALAGAATEAQVGHPELAELLHSSGVKVPEGATEFNPAGVSQVLPLRQIRFTCQQVLRVQAALPGAIARSRIVPTHAPGLVDTDALTAMVAALWFGKFPLAPSSPKASLEGFMDQQEMPKLVHGDSGEAGCWLLGKWPVVVAALELCFPTDRSIGSTMKLVTTHARGDASASAAELGVRRVVVPFILQLNQDWERFQEGRAFVSVGESWLTVSKKQTVEKFIRDGGASVRETATLRGSVEELKAAVKLLTDAGKGGPSARLPALPKVEDGEEEDPAEKRARRKAAKQRRRERDRENARVADEARDGSATTTRLAASTYAEAKKAEAKRAADAKAAAERRKAEAEKSSTPAAKDEAAGRSGTMAATVTKA